MQSKRQFQWQLLPFNDPLEIDFRVTFLESHSIRNRNSRSPDLLAGNGIAASKTEINKRAHATPTGYPVYGFEGFGGPSSAQARRAGKCVTSQSHTLTRRACRGGTVRNRRITVWAVTSSQRQTIRPAGRNRPYLERTIVIIDSLPNSLCACGRRSDSQSQLRNPITTKAILFLRC